MLKFDLLRQSLWDFVKSMVVLHSRGRCITVFGSARLLEDAPAYQLALDLGRSLGRAGFSVMTGGGPGLMEAANRGAMEAGALSLGCRMAFSFEQAANGHFDRCATVRYFFVRKVVMCTHAAGFVVLPGGIGTLDELFEILALVQTRRMRRKPIVLLGAAYWEPLLVVLQKMVVAGTIAPMDLTILRVTDDISDAVSMLIEPTASSPLEQVEKESSAA